jgi:hypothetical protein
LIGIDQAPGTDTLGWVWQQQFLAVLDDMLDLLGRSCDVFSKSSVTSTENLVGNRVAFEDKLNC